MKLTLQDAAEAVADMLEARAERDAAEQRLRAATAHARKTIQAALPPLPDGWDWLVDSHAKWIDVRAKGPHGTAWTHHGYLMSTHRSDGRATVPKAVVDALWAVASAMGEGGK